MRNGVYLIINKLAIIKKTPINFRGRGRPRTNGVKPATNSTPYKKNELFNVYRWLVEQSGTLGGMD